MSFKDNQFKGGVRTLEEECSENTKVQIEGSYKQG